MLDASGPTVEDDALGWAFAGNTFIGIHRVAGYFGAGGFSAHLGSSAEAEIHSVVVADGSAAKTWTQVEVPIHVLPWETQPLGVRTEYKVGGGTILNGRDGASFQMDIPPGMKQWNGDLMGHVAAEIADDRQAREQAIIKKLKKR